MDRGWGKGDFGASHRRERAAWQPFSPASCSGREGDAGQGRGESVREANAFVSLTGQGSMIRQRYRSLGRGSSQRTRPQGGRGGALCRPRPAHHPWPRLRAHVGRLLLTSGTSRLMNETRESEGESASAREEEKDGRQRGGGREYAGSLRETPPPGWSEDAPLCRT